MCVKKVDHSQPITTAQSSKQADHQSHPPPVAPSAPAALQYQQVAFLALILAPDPMSALGAADAAAAAPLPTVPVPAPGPLRVRMSESESDDEEDER